VGLEILSLPLEGLKFLRAKPFHDERGFFWEAYRLPLYRELGIGCDFVQDNHSFSRRGTLRGMHFQRRPGQAKLVSVLEGEIFDVAVDLRPGSPTFKKWHGVRLVPGEQIFVPVGFAHGFCVVSSEAHVIYKVSSVYDPAEGVGFSPLDQEIGIRWPDVGALLLSPRDAAAPPFREVFA
jgi:dTDP-4-dehydrorhamnose 3,5-epimerase